MLRKPVFYVGVICRDTSIMCYNKTENEATKKGERDKKSRVFVEL